MLGHVLENLVRVFRSYQQFGVPPVLNAHGLQPRSRLTGCFGLAFALSFFCGGIFQRRYDDSGIITVIVENKKPLTVPDQVRRRAGFKPGETMTAGEAKKVRHALKQARKERSVPWSQIKRELGL